MTTTDSRVTDGVTDQELIRTHVRARIAKVQSAYLADASWARAAAARLRDAVKAPIGDDPQAYRVMFEELPKRLVGGDDEPGRAELAIHLSMALFGIHQQSGRGRASHVAGERFGAAVARLARPDALESREQPIMRRFTALVTATEFSEVAQHLRGIIQLFRASDPPIALDYGQLAVDLYDLQHPATRDRVRLRWSRDAIARPRSRAGSDAANATTSAPA